uniref:Intraflagellar transport 88 n=1 Tax=Plectus sambesii TaxID=2011161 RepID=A0A914XBJ9_9BILA
MSLLQNVHLTGSMESDDLYSGFNDYNHALDAENLLNDEGFQQAVARTSHGRRPLTAKQGVAGSAMVGGRLATAVARVGTSTSGLRGQTAFAGGRTAAAGQTAAGPRPMTAVRGAGYTSHGRTSSFDPSKGSSDKPEEGPEEKCKQIERKVNELLEDSIFAYEKRDFKLALEKAKDAGRRERAAVKMREQLGLMEQVNLDLTFSVLFNLAHQYTASEMYNEALNTYQVIVKNKMFTNAGRLKVNIGNIYFKKKDYSKAIKYYRMALDQVPNVQKETRIKILNNIGVAFVKLGKYDEAGSTFEHCMEEKPEFRTGLNLILCAYTLEDREKMKDGFQRLLDIQLDVDDDDKYISHNNDRTETLLLEVIKNDSLRQWEKQRRQEAERTILTAARLVSPAIASTFSEGYAWCVDSIKNSIYAELATDLEINKAIQYLRQGELPAAAEVLKSFEKKDSKVASAAANNLAFLSLLQGPDKFSEAVQYAEQALAADRYNPNALVNRGNVCFAQNELAQARDFYKEALANEASCVEGLYNLGLVCKQMGKMEEALDCFYKLHNILMNNVQVLCQLGSIYEQLEDTAQAIELFTQASNLAPTDPGILAKLGELYDSEGDKSQAFQCHYDSYRYFPSNIEVIEWLGAYYIDAQFSEKAVSYFERAAIMQPNEIKWHLMTASCQRRSGNYQKALDTYKTIHRKFPDNIECLKFLVRLCTDLGMPEGKDYANKLKKAEKVRELRQQRTSASSAGRARGSSSAQSLPPGTTASVNRQSVSRNSLRTASARITFDQHEQYQVTNRHEIGDADTNYNDPLGPAPERPKTSMRRRGNDDDTFDNEEVGDDLLPE